MKGGGEGGVYGGFAVERRRKEEKRLSWMQGMKGVCVRERARGGRVEGGGAEGRRRKLKLGKCASERSEKKIKLNAADVVNTVNTMCSYLAGVLSSAHLYAQPGVQPPFRCCSRARST